MNFHRKPLRHPGIMIWLLLTLGACDHSSNSAIAARDVHTSGALAATPGVEDDRSTSPCAVSTIGLAIRVCGNRLVDAKGVPVQLRGVNLAGLEAVAIQGWDPANPWGGAPGTSIPDWNAIKAWGANAVRLPMNEASWLGLSCVDHGGTGFVVERGDKQPNKPGKSVRADPGDNYKATVANTVAAATAAGLYVIVDLHLTAPGDGCPNAQNAMADADHALAFWTSLATALKRYPNVLFELFNEPFLDQAPLQGAQPWEALLNGKGTIDSYTVQGSPATISSPWHAAGMQQMLNAVRATGATNVVLTSTLAYSSAMDGWLQYHPTDSLHPGQLGAVWHAYPASSLPRQVNCVGLPSCSAKIMESVRAILATGYPVVITEYGDAVGGSNAPFASILLPFADDNGISYFGWTWNPWIGTTYYLITDGTGHPTPGYGVYVKAHYLCRAAGTANCP